MSESNGPHFCYSIPDERFFYRTGRRWRFDAPQTEQGIVRYLVGKERVTQKQAKEVINSGDYVQVHGIDVVPGGPEFVADDDGNLVLNIYHPPTITPAAGEYPTIRRVMGWLTNHDADGEAWLFNWMAAKIQNPSLLPRTAVVFSGQPRSGKGTFAGLMNTMLGPDNCASIGRRALDTQFNARWVNKLFVLADEIADSDRRRQVFEDLKILIANDYTELEAKFANQARQRNRLAWVIATNDKVSPVVVEHGDRRYTVFTNQEALTQDYKAAIMGAYQPGGAPTPAFQAEIQGLYAALLAHPVDLAAVSVPYANAAREVLQDASAGSIELFIRSVETEGIDRWLIHHYDMDLGDYKFDFGAAGIDKLAVYQAYKLFCKRTGMTANRKAGFEAGIANHHPTWPSTLIDGVSCYVLPRGLLASS